jgi:hypothetical protein
MKKTFITLVAFLFVLSACNEKELSPITGSNGKPSVVTDIQTEEIPGGVQINYRIPEEEDLLAVKAVYTLTNGKTKELVSSFYENNIEIQGYTDVEEHAAMLYSMNRGGEMSDPVEVTFTPLESALKKAYNSMEIKTDFGGARFNWLNPDKDVLSLEFLADDSVGVLQTYKVLTSQDDTATYSLRGFNAEPTTFGVIVSDLWENVSDTIFPAGRKLTPLYEKKLDKTKWSFIKLANDISSWNNWEGTSLGIIDDDVSTIGHSPVGVLPGAFTIDLGVTAKLSRLVIWQWDDDCEYAWGNPKGFEVYGRADAPGMSGDWSEWTKIMDCTIVKPSGLPVGTNTDADIAALEAGHEFTVDVDAGDFRYIRIKILDTWGSSTFTHIAEVTMYGSEAN